MAADGGTLCHMQKQTATTVKVIAVLAAIVIVAGAGWFAYQRSAGARGEPDAAGSVAFDSAKAEAELDALSQKVNNAMTSDQVTAALVDEVQGLVQRYPRYAPARVLFGQVLAQEGDAQRAYEQLAASLELDPRQVQVHVLAGTLAEVIGKLDRAGWHYSQAISLEPGDATHRLRLANVYFQQQDYDTARRQALDALRLNSEEHRAYALLADIFAKQNKLELALQETVKAIEHTPADDRTALVIYTRKRGILLRRANRPAEALQVLMGLFPAERRQDEVMADLATCWMMLGQPVNAAGVYEEALKIDPTAWRWVADAAQWRIKAGDLAGAQEHLKTIRLLNPRAPVIAELQEQLAQAGQ